MKWKIDDYYDETAFKALRLSFPWHFNPTLYHGTREDIDARVFRLTPVRPNTESPGKFFHGTFMQGQIVSLLFFFLFENNR